MVARAEVALAARELGPAGRDRALEAAVEVLDRQGDRHNALLGRLVAVRRFLMTGRLDLAEHELSMADLGGAPPVLVAIGEIATAELAVRSSPVRIARAALARARAAAVRAGLGALRAEVEVAATALDAPAARVSEAGQWRPVRLDEVEVFRGSGLLVDACRRTVGDAQGAVSLATRPVLFALVRALAEAWPGDAPRAALIAVAFGVRRANESHRGRLRVEIGRLRTLLRAVCEVKATARGFGLVPRREGGVRVLVPPIDGPGAAVLALLSDGQSWSTAALALALGQSQRTVQRVLAELEVSAKVEARGSARARRWQGAPIADFTMTLLLPAPPIR